MKTKVLKLSLTLSGDALRWMEAKRATGLPIAVIVRKAIEAAAKKEARK